MARRVRGRSTEDCADWLGWVGADYRATRNHRVRVRIQDRAMTSNLTGWLVLCAVILAAIAVAILERSGGDDV